MATRKIWPGTLCECCLVEDATDCHEITAGAHRHRAVYEHLAQMHVCRECHIEIQGKPYAEQVAAKLEAIVAAVNRCCERNAITIDDVIKAIK